LFQSTVVLLDETGEADGAAGLNGALCDGARFPPVIYEEFKHSITISTSFGGNI
jgi:hypothetical protein